MDRQMDRFKVRRKSQEEEPSLLPQNPQKNVTDAQGNMFPTLRVASDMSIEIYSAKCSSYVHI